MWNMSIYLLFYWTAEINIQRVCAHLRAFIYIKLTAFTWMHMIWCDLYDVSTARSHRFGGGSLVYFISFWYFTLERISYSSLSCCFNWNISKQKRLQALLNNELQISLFYFILMSGNESVRYMQITTTINNFVQIHIIKFISFFVGTNRVCGNDTMKSGCWASFSFFFCCHRSS